MIRAYLVLMSLLLTLSVVEPAKAWGRRGHALINTTAAYLIHDEIGADFFSAHSFDLSYYGNIPDNLWKDSSTFTREHPEHYMDIEIFDRVLKTDSSAYLLGRAAFDLKYPTIPQSAGRAFWRIQELDQGLESMAVILRKPTLSKDDRAVAQAQWLFLAGVIGHYVGDLSQPLHVTENFDGQMTGQKGVHAFFENTIVDELYPDLETEVIKGARAEWSDYEKAHAKTSLFELLRELQKSSSKDLPNVLELDKKTGRKDRAKAVGAYRPLIRYRMIQATLCLTEIWRRHLGWKPDDDHFFLFLHKPPYIEPGTTGAMTSTKVDVPNTERKAAPPSYSSLVPSATPEPTSTENY